MEKLLFASDHAGFPLKKKIVDYFLSKGFECVDLGCLSEDRVDYPDYGHKLAIEVLKNNHRGAFAFCGSGNGIAMSLNRHKGIRAAICWSKEIAMLARAHNDANVCVLPGRFCEFKDAVEIAEIYLSTGFDGGRHKQRIDKIDYVD